MYLETGHRLSFTSAEHALRPGGRTRQKSRETTKSQDWMPTEVMVLDIEQLDDTKKCIVT